MLLLPSADFFQNDFFIKILSGALSECQTVRIQIRTDILSVLIWVPTVFKSYQQTASVNYLDNDDTSREQFRNEFDFWKVHGIMNTSGFTYFARDPKYS